jgi:hypothetical protein
MKFVSGFAALKPYHVGLNQRFPNSIHVKPVCLQCARIYPQTPTAPQAVQKSQPSFLIKA